MSAHSFTRFLFYSAGSECHLPSRTELLSEAGVAHESARLINLNQNRSLISNLQRALQKKNQQPADHYQETVFTTGKLDINFTAVMSRSGELITASRDNNAQNSAAEFNQSSKVAKSKVQHT